MENNKTDLDDCVQLQVPNFSTRLQDSLYELQQDGFLCDTTIHTSTGQILAHKCVLVAGSLYFYEIAKFIFKKEDWPWYHTSDKGVVGYKLLSEKHHIVELVLKLLYKGQVYCAEENLEDLKRLCTLLKVKWEIHSLRSKPKSIPSTISHLPENAQVRKIGEIFFVPHEKNVVSSNERTRICTSVKHDQQPPKAPIPDDPANNSSMTVAMFRNVRQKSKRNKQTSQATKTSLLHDLESMITAGVKESANNHVSEDGDVSEYSNLGKDNSDTEDDLWFPGNSNVTEDLDFTTALKKPQKRKSSSPSKKVIKKVKKSSPKQVKKKLKPSQVKHNQTKQTRKTIAKELSPSDTESDTDSSTGGATGEINPKSKVPQPKEPVDINYIVIPAKRPDPTADALECLAGSCKKKYEQHEDLLTHFEQYPGHKRPIKCLICQEPFWNRETFKHHRTAVHPPSLKLFPCPECKHTVKRYIRLVDHMYFVHNTPLSEHMKIYKCKQEGCTFQRCTKYSVSVHYRERHTDEKVCTCEICGKTMLRGAVRQHMEVHKDASDRRRAKCDYCGMMILQQCLQTHIDRIHLKVNKKNKLCHLCSYQSDMPACLDQHLLRVHGVFQESRQLLHCPKCDFVAYHKGTLKQHIRVHPDPGVIFPCETCDKIFTLKQHLESHIKRVHSANAVKEFCPHSGCTYSSIYKKNIKEHFETRHTPQNIKPQQCPHCEYACKTAGNLRKHIRGVHKIEVETTYTLRKKAMETGKGYPNNVVNNRLVDMASMPSAGSGFETGYVYQNYPNPFYQS